MEEGREGVLTSTATGHRDVPIKPDGDAWRLCIVMFPVFSYVCVREYACSCDFGGLRTFIRAVFTCRVKLDGPRASFFLLYCKAACGELVAATEHADQQQEVFGSMKGKSSNGILSPLLR